MAYDTNRAVRGRLPTQTASVGRLFHRRWRQKRLDTMTEKELRRLSRADLLEMLIDQSVELEQTQKKLAAAEEALASRVIEINSAGSIAEAALRLNGVFEAAQAACDQYVQNINLLNERSEMVCRRMEQESREKADRLLEETRRKCQAMETGEPEADLPPESVQSQEDFTFRK